MITCEFMGRLGNNMFQIATVYAMAKKNDDVAEFAPFPYFNLPRRSTSVENLYVENNPLNKLIDIKHQKNMSIAGFFQHYEYFDFIKTELFDIFNVPTDYLPNTIGVHVRRGDFLLDPINFPTQPLAYYYEAFKRIGIKGKEIVFCSDDIAWCEANFSHLPNVKFRNGRNELKDIYFLANCEYVIMSNSTFSFWGAYLNKFAKAIYFPLHWFAKDSGRNGYEICLKNWIGL